MYCKFVLFSFLYFLFGYTSFLKPVFKGLFFLKLIIKEMCWLLNIKFEQMKPKLGEPCCSLGKPALSCRASYELLSVAGLSPGTCSNNKTL